MVARRPSLREDEFSSTEIPDSEASSGAWSVRTNFLSVVLIEDSEADAFVLERILTNVRAPVSIRHAQTKADAFTLLQERTPDLILLDMHLPDSTGPNAIVEFQSQCPSAAILVLTGVQDEAVAREALQLGAHDYLVKGTFDGEVLMRAMRFAVERARSEHLRHRLLHNDRLMSIGKLAAGVAHEITNPLSFISQNVVALFQALEHEELDRNELREALKDVQLGVERIQSISRSLGTFSRLEATEREFVDVADVARGAAKIVANQIRHNAEFITNFPVVSPVSGNAGQLSQVFVNLLVNANQAIQQAPQGEHEIRFTISDEKRGVVISIEDTGPGVSENLRAQVFDPFFTTKKREVGTGLGLTLCQDIVEKMGGRLELASSAEGGARFDVVLPPSRTSMEKTSLTSTLRPVPHRLPRCRILVVDDDALVLKGYERLLKDEHDVTCAQSAQEALKILRDETEFRLILCDLMMPEMDGQDFFEALQRWHPRVASRLVFASGGAFTPRAKGFAESWGAQIHQKPITKDTVSKLLAKNIGFDDLDD